MDHGRCQESVGMSGLHVARVPATRQFDKPFQTFAFVAPPLIVC